MAIKKSTLNQLKRNLKKYGIRAEAITACAIKKERSIALVRMTLNGDTEDKNDIIEFLLEYLEKEKAKQQNIANRIETL